jgi:hypothetical protein
LVLSIYYSVSRKQNVDNKIGKISNKEKKVGKSVNFEAIRQI